MAPRHRAAQRPGLWRLDESLRPGRLEGRQRLQQGRSRHPGQRVPAVPPGGRGRGRGDRRQMGGRDQGLREDGPPAAGIARRGQRSQREALPEKVSSIFTAQQVS